jgi:hypothetical protein
VNIETIRERVRAGNYLIKSGAVQHALKEDFERKHMVEAILEGCIIEEYPDDQRALICGTARISNVSLYLHFVCDYADPMYTEIVTVYIPDESTWEWPSFRRRRL